MASRHHSLQMTEVADVIDILIGFQAHNTVRLAVELTVATLGNVPSLQLVVTAYRPVGIGVEPAPLACVECDTRTMNLRNLKDAVTHALYALDFRLALDEFGGTKTAVQTAPPTPE